MEGRGMDTALPEEQALPQDQSDLPEGSASSSDLQSVRDPTGGMNAKDRVQATLRVLAETQRARALVTGRESSGQWHRVAWKSTRVWVRRSNKSCGRGRCA